MESDELRLASEYHRGYEDGKRNAKPTPMVHCLEGIRSVYLSGPMSGVEQNNAGMFARWHAWLRECGISDVFDPAYEWMADDRDFPHEEYLRRTIHQLTRQEGYDCIIMLPGWQTSEGAVTEMTVADACGIRVLMGEVIVKDGVCYLEVSDPKRLGEV